MHTNYFIMRTLYDVGSLSFEIVREKFSHLLRAVATTHSAHCFEIVWNNLDYIDLYLYIYVYKFKHTISGLKQTKDLINILIFFR